VLRSYGLSDPGKVRPGNEDRFLIGELVRTLWVHQSNVPQREIYHGRDRSHVLLVADGMGGHQAGEVASALTVTTIESFVLHLLRKFSHLQATDEQTLLKEFQTALRQADARLFEEAAEHPELAGMGTTLTLAFANGWKLFVVHVGDSRCYLLRAGKLQQVTTDHTLAEELVKQGVIQPDEVRGHRLRHVITNALGGGKEGVEVDLLRADLAPGDVLLLCTDGLTDMLDDGRVAALLTGEADPKAACERLVAEANQKGGKDNITAIVAHFDSAGGHP
jgi:protein phosphatase